MNRIVFSLTMTVVALGCGTSSESTSRSQPQTERSTPQPQEADEPNDGEPPTPPSPFTMPAVADKVDRARYVADLEAIARPRPPGSAHWRAVQELCAERLASLGFEVERHSYGSGTNVIGRLPGTDRDGTPDQTPGQSGAPWVILSAHYDSTDETCPGADDNASGVAGLLESARVLSGIRHRRTLIAACWDEEERGLIGSDAYAGRLATARQPVAMMYDYEMIGYASQESGSQKLPQGFALMYPKAVEQLKANGERGDFIALVYDDNPGPRRAADIYQRAAASLGLPVVALPVPDAVKKSDMVRPLRRSDHDSFWTRDMPGMMLTDTANFRNAHYHCTGGVDSVDRLDHDFSVKVIKATVASALALLAGE